MGTCKEAREKLYFGDQLDARTALYAGFDVVGPLYATTTELAARFREIAQADGLPAAVRWRFVQCGS
jgi:hypothetical protein